MERKHHDHLPQRGGCHPWRYCFSTQRHPHAFLIKGVSVLCSSLVSLKDMVLGSDWGMGEQDRVRIWERWGMNIVPPVRTFFLFTFSYFPTHFKTSFAYSQLYFTLGSRWLPGQHSYHWQLRGGFPLPKKKVINWAARKNTQGGEPLPQGALLVRKPPCQV